jgi:hypothetical protein
VLLVQEWEACLAQLQNLADTERVQLYAVLGEDAAMVRQMAEVNPPAARDMRPSQAQTPLEPVLIPTPHPAADPERAVEQNAEYQQKLARWQALPWWKRWRAPKPVRPAGI